MSRDIEVVLGGHGFKRYRKRNQKIKTYDVALNLLNTGFGKGRLTRPSKDFDDARALYYEPVDDFFLLDDYTEPGHMPENTRKVDEDKFFTVTYLWGDSRKPSGGEEVSISWKPLGDDKKIEELNSH